jgi:hypothetical protein
MTQSAFKTLLLIVGSALGGIVLFVAGIAALVYFGDLPFHDVVLGGRTTTVAKAPDIAASRRYLGSHARYSGDFPTRRDTVLASGPGHLAGMITAAGRPVKGLRLRLMLNGSVMSPWGESDADGRYVIDVPYGRYQINGYELASATADAVLPGKIENSRNDHASDVFVVSAEHAGRAPNLDFVDPVRKREALGDVSRKQPIVVGWEPYPGAHSYQIQLLEWDDEGHRKSVNYVFDPRDNPVVMDTTFNPADYAVELKKGHYYALTIFALDEKQNELAQTPLGAPGGRADFRVVD